MDDRPLEDAATAGGTSRFELAPPRRFILPAILLLISEEPGYGYGLVPRLRNLRFGHVDRPAVYRALAQLEADGLVEGVAEGHAAARPARRVYRTTALGERVLRVWMGVIKEEHDQLGHVLRRYQTTGTADAVLAEVEGGWATALGYGWSPVSSTSAGLHRLAPIDTEMTAGSRGAAPPARLLEGSIDGRVDGSEDAACTTKRFVLVPDRSVVLIEVRSTVGPLSFGTVGVTGSIEAAVVDGAVQQSVPPAAQILIDVSGLRSGNRLYDAELLRRIEARRFPTAMVKLCECAQPASGNLFRLMGELTFHGLTRPASGTVRVQAISGRRLVITGEQVFDIRDYALPSPTVLMLRIYPDVRVRLHVEAEIEEEDS